MKYCELLQQVQILPIQEPLPPLPKDDNTYFHLFYHTFTDFYHDTVKHHEKKKRNNPAKAAISIPNSFYEFEKALHHKETCPMNEEQQKEEMDESMKEWIDYLIQWCEDVDSEIVVSLDSE